MELGPIIVVMAITVIGALMGSACALVPGFHSNALALVLLSLFAPISAILSPLSLYAGPSVPPALLFATLLVAAATAHSFVDFVPSIFLGVPDEDTVLSVLPAHRLLKSGKGLEAIQHAAAGSLCGALVAILLAVPLQILLHPPSPVAAVLDSSVPYVLACVLFLLVLTERGHESPGAHLDSRKSPRPERGTISICHPIPVNSAESILSGIVRRRGLRSFWLSTPSGRWRVVYGLRRKPRGFVTVQGVWTVRRPRTRGRLKAALVLVLSGTLGFVVMNARPPLSGILDGLGQSLLFPLLSGLFAFPALLTAASSRPIPEQSEAREGVPSVRPAIIGTFSGFLAGWMPGITSTIGTVIGSCFSPRPKDQEAGAKTYILMLSAVGTSSVVFSLLALCIEGSGRTGAMLALQQAVGPELQAQLSSFPSASASLLLLSALIASIVGYRCMLFAGAVLSRRTSGKDLGRVNMLVLAALSALILLFNGTSGLVVASVATLVGCLPARLGVRRVHLTGCLLLPLLLFYLDLERTAIGLLW
jgi:TctA family transporter